MITLKKPSGLKNPPGLLFVRILYNNGTMQEWQRIKKEDDYIWSSRYEIRCTDGVISKGII